LDLGITQKSLRVRLKEEEKGGKGHSFFHEQIGRRRAREQGRFLDRRRRRQQLGTHSKAALANNKEELSNWFSPRVVGGFSRVTLTKNHCVIFCVWLS
jgi:hypothetical protein